VILTRTVRLADPLARANVVDALQGAGAPLGVLELIEAGQTISVRFDAAITAPELIDDLIAIESVFVPARTPPIDDADEVAAMAAAGLGDPDLDASRILETYTGRAT
jgi:hypothetical protein